MKRLRCEDCGTTFFTAAARSMLERGERCTVCGGRLRLDDDDRRLRRIRVGPDEDGDGDRTGGSDVPEG